MRATESSVLALLAALAVACPAAAETTIGALGAANPTIEGTAPTAETRVLILGSDVVQDETISTSADGSGQVIFLDQTTLSIAPNSDVVLDRYVYDPDISAGEIGVSLTKGALRFIGGRITKQTSATVRTPTATIGIRGGAVLIGVGETGETQIIHVAGEWTRITANGEEIDLRRTGAKVRVSGDAPQNDGVASQAEIDAFYAQFEGGGGGLKTRLTQRAAIDGVSEDLTFFGASEKGNTDDGPVATSGASPVLRDAVVENEGDYQNTIVPPTPDADPNDDGGNTGGGGGGMTGGGGGVTGGGETGPFENEVPLDGVTGVALVAPGAGFLAPNGAAVEDPAAQNVLLAPQTVDPLVEVFEGESGTETDGVIDIERFSRNGYNEAGERYVIPVDPSGGAFQYFDGESPRITDPIITGDSDLDSSSDFTTAFYDPDQPDTRSRVFFGLGTPGQLGAPQGVGGPEQRVYNLRPDPFLGSGTPILPSGVANAVEVPSDLTLRIIEEPGEGLFRESSGNNTGGGGGGPVTIAERGFAKAGFASLSIDGVGQSQTSILVIGTGRVTPTSDEAPSPDIGIFGSVDNQSASPDILDGTATLVAFGDGSTLIGENAENLVLASASRFIFDADEDYEVTPLQVSSWEGDAPEPRGFAHVGDLASQEVQPTDERLPLGEDYADAVEDNPGVFVPQNDDTAFTGGYVAALGRSRVDGETSRPYIIHSDGRGVQMAFDASQNEANAALNFIGGASTLLTDGEGTTISGNGTEQQSEIAFGSFGFGSASTRSLLTNDNDFLLRNKTSEEHNFRTGVTQINGDTGRSTQVPGAEQQAFRGALVPIGTVGDGGSQVFPTTEEVDTDHEYLRWGYWSGEFRFGPDNATGSRFNEREERFHLGTFVAGNRLDEIDLPETGEASFDGFAVVSVSEAGRDYVDGGSFSMTYDFGDRNGRAEFRDLAGYDFSTFVSDRAYTLVDGGEGVGSDHFGGDIRDSGTGSVGDTDFRPDVDGTISGSFFTDAVGEDVLATAGRIDFQSIDDDGAALIASGVFGGDGSVDEEPRQ